MTPSAMVDLPGRSRRIDLALVLLGAGTALGVGIWAQPRLEAKRRAANELAAGIAIMRLARAQTDFRANDRDLNGVPDFWTGDVAGLWRFGLIPRAIAEADAAPIEPLVPEPRPYHGYFFRALRWDDSESPPVDYRQDTDGSGQKVRHTSRFGFCAYPASYGRTGGAAVIVNEENDQRWWNRAVPPWNWPSDRQMMRICSRR